MATRIYLPSSGSAPVTPSTWNHANQAGTTYTLKGVLTKGTTALTSRTTATGTTNPYTRAVMRYVIGPLRATQISGTINAVMRCSESNSGANATMSIAAKIIQPNGTDRAVLLAATASASATSTYEFTTTLGSRRAYNASETIPIPLTAQTPTDGDYLVIELGFRSATGTTYNVVMQHGDNSTSDLPDSNGNTSAYAPWVEFSGDIAWLTTPTVTVSAPSSVTETSATGNGEITDTGGESATKRGFVWSTSTQAAPGNVAPGSSGYSNYGEDTGTFSTGTFTAALSSLADATTYYLRSYAYNSQGYAYSSEISFSTLGYVRISPSSYISASAADATTARLTPPSDKTTSNFQAARISDDTNPLPSIDFGDEVYTEPEFCYVISPNSGVGDEYELRITAAGTPLDSYTNIAKITVGSSGQSGVVAESSTITDAFAAIVTRLASLADTVAATDSQAGIVFTAHVVSESAATGDIFAGGSAVASAVSESAAGADTVSGAATRAGAVAESVASGDTATAQLAAVASLAETVSANSSASAIAAIGAAVNESAAVTESQSWATFGQATISESATVHDQQTSTASYSAIVAESAVCSDAVTVTVSTSAGVIETVAIADTVAATVGGMLAVMAESAALSDTVSAIASAAAICSEVAIALDSMSAMQASSVAIAESAAIADAPSATAALGASITEQVTIADILAAARATLAELSFDTLTITDEYIAVANPPGACVSSIVIGVRTGSLTIGVRTGSLSIGVRTGSLSIGVRTGKITST